MTESEIEARVLRAKELFHMGYNCSQSVFASCADLFHFSDEETALKIAASFGGGIGRMRMVCGAASGMFLLAGLQNGSPIAGDAQGKADNYARVQALAKQFEQTYGSLICAELLGLAPKQNTCSTPAERTPEYYQKRPCSEMVGEAVRIFLSTLDEQSK